MFGLGVVEMGVVGCVAVLLFGGRLPKLARSVGQSVVEFRRGFLEVEKECAAIEQEMREKA